MRLNFPKPPCNCHSNQGALAEWSRIETWRLSSLGHVKACPTRTLETQAFRPSPLSHGLRTAQENMQKPKTQKTQDTLNTLSDVRFPWSNRSKGRGGGLLFLRPSWEFLVLHLGVTTVTCKTNTKG
jgi:hypothetical protein